MVRFILIMILIVFFAIFSLIALPIIAFIGIFDPSKKQTISQGVVSRLLSMILFLAGTKVTVKGRENIPDNEPVLFVSNHRSYFDFVVSYSILPHLTGFVGKAEFAKVPLMNIWMKNLKCIFLNRTDPREGLKGILIAIDQVKSGMSMYIAPEGTRNHKPDMLPFKPGSLKIAEKTGCRIVPMAFTHTDEVYELHWPRVEPAHVTLEFGKPISVQGIDPEGKKRLLETTQSAIRDMINANLAAERIEQK